jgi:predicted RNA-binding protein with PIN domain
MDRNEKGREGIPLREGVPLYLVDGYNVIFGARFKGGSGNFEDTRERFIRLLDTYGKRKKVEIVVVWDGKGPEARGRAVKNLSSIAGASADERIVRLVERSGSRARITVVSDDRRHIVGVVKNLGAKTIGVEEFLDLVGFSRGGGNKNARVSPEKKSEDAQREKRPAGGLSVDEWLNLFKAKE